MTHGMYMKRLSAQIPVTILCLIIAGLAQPRKAAAQAPLQNTLGDQNIAPFWTYDNLDLGVKQARETGKPLLVTIRCVPCHACRGMDQKVVNPTDFQLITLMNQFVCVRIVQAWGLDLSLFQYDMNQSWAAFLMNADGVIYGRYGTRAAKEMTPPFR
jgi:serine protease Do